MAVKNGALYIKEQIDSILPQLQQKDELVISDDSSSDHTLQIIKSYNDPRIKTLANVKSGLISNFENCLAACKGDYIFLSDQDDVWANNKIEVMHQHLLLYDVVISDCVLVDKYLTKERDSFYRQNGSGKGMLRNLIRNSYMGCCMAFHRRVLKKVLPFPPQIPMHDLWIGMIGEFHYRVLFIPDKLLYHRRHLNNASTTSGKSRYALSQKLRFRYQIIKSIIKLSYA